MYKKGGIPVLTIVIAVIIIIVLYFLFRPTCPDCEDNNPCTTDSCGSETDHKCKNLPLNGPQPGCSAEVGCGTKTCKDGVCDANYKDDCCGNKKCETGETYTSCAEDCPNCEDENECTKDSYDYHLQKCVNEAIKPCCGNGICDKGAETDIDCKKDCPNCDDSNESTKDSFNYNTQKCENILTYYFTDDFEGGVGNWVFSDAEGKPSSAGWGTAVENGNTVLRGVGHNWANLNAGPWENYALELRFKIVKGNINFNYHINLRETFSRYMITLDSNRVSLGKSIDETYTMDMALKDGISLGDGWHKLEIRGYGNVINVYIDSDLMFKYTDDSNPILSGKIAFETLGDSETAAEFLIDNLEIKIVKEEDVSA